MSVQGSAGGGIVAGAQWLVTGATQISVVSYYNIARCEVVAATGEMRFFFDDQEAVLPTDLVVPSTVLTPPTSIGRSGALLTVGGVLQASIRPLTGATLADGGFVVVRLSPPLGPGVFPTPIVSTLGA